MTGRRSGWLRWGFYVLSFVLIQILFILYRNRFAVTLKEKEDVRRVQINVDFQMILVMTSLYIWKRVLGALKEAVETWRGHAVARVVKALLFVFLLLAHLAPLAYVIPPSSEPFIVTLLILISFALYLHVLVFFLIGQLFLLLSAAANRFGMLRSFSRRYSYIRSLLTFVAVGISLTLVLAGVFTAFSVPLVKNVEIPIMRRDSEFAPRLILLSDVHIGPSVGLRRTQTIADIVNSQDPDIVAIAGDLADGFVKDLSVAANPLCHLQSRHGVYFSTGNHEYSHGNVDEWFDLLRSCNVTVLHNENRRVALSNGDTVCIAGTDDLVASRSGRPGHGMNYTKALSGCRAEDVVILLAHQPNAAQIVLDDTVKPSHVDLILSGHTHAGQMYPLVPFVQLVNAFTHGLYKVKETFVYVSAGVNFFGPPVKILGACEVTSIQLSTRKNV